MDFYSPLRYPGGKGKIAHFFKRLFKENYLYDAVYIEPYAGGASIALSLLFNEYASKVIINDIDRSIYSFWHSVLSDTDGICRLIHDTPINIDTWRNQKSIQKNKASISLTQLGFSTLFLNRTNRSGILNAGVIGGTNQNGPWRMNARFNKAEVIRRIQRVAKYRDRISALNLDASDLIRSVRNNLPKKSLLYFDPPYYAKGRDLYLNHYKHEDHVSVATEIKSLFDHNWIVTYDNVPFIRKLYSEFRQAKYRLTYTARSYSSGEEVMILSPSLHLSSLSSRTITGRHLA
jgi:DNA adenine methylase